VLDPATGCLLLQLNTAWKHFESGVMRRLVLKEGIRMDGRKVTDIRPIWSRASVLPRTHGSALFTRGETQVRPAAMRLTGALLATYFYILLHNGL